MNKSNTKKTVRHKQYFICCLFVLIGLIPQLGMAQSFQNESGTSFKLFGTTSPENEILFNKGAKDCNEYTVVFTAVSSGISLDVNGTQLDTWLDGTPATSADGTFELNAEETSSGSFICKVTISNPSVTSNVPILLDPNSPNANCYNGDFECDGVNSVDVCTDCAAAFGAGEVTAGETVGGFPVCATIIGEGGPTNPTRLFYFCFKREFSTQPMIDGAFSNLNHGGGGTDCKIPFEDDTAFSPDAPGGFTANSIYFKIINGSGNYRLVTEGCTNQLPNQLEAVQVAQVEDEGNIHAYWKVNLTDENVSLNDTYCFCLQDVNTGQLVLASDGTTESICISVCYDPDKPKVPDDVVFVVDRSGSMRETINGSQTNPISKFDAVTIVFGAIITGWKEVDPLDKLGLVWFSDQLFNPYRVGNSTIFSINDDRIYSTAPACLNISQWSILDALCRITPSGGTSLGNGLQTSLDILEAEDLSRNKHIILLTDGEQNLPPYVTIERYVDYQFSAGGRWGRLLVPEEIYANYRGGNLVLRKPDRSIHTFNSITSGANSRNIINPKIHVGAFNQGETSNYGRFLSKLADATAGKKRFFQGSINNIRREGEEFASELHDLFGTTLETESPRQVHSNVRSVSGSEAVEEFPIAGDYTLLQIIAGNVARNAIKFSKIEVLNSSGSWVNILPLSSGVSVNPPDSIGSPYQVFTIDFNDTEVSPGSRMKVTIKSTSSNFNYYLKAFVDDLGIKFRTSIERSSIPAGEPIPLKASIFQKDNTSPTGFKAITPALGGKVRAIIKRPKKSYTRIFSETHMPRKYTDCDCSNGRKKSGQGLLNVIDLDNISGDPTLTTRSSARSGAASVSTGVLAGYTSNFQLSSEGLNADFEVGNNYLETKLFIIDNEKDYQTKKEIVTEEIELTHRGSGVYTASYPNTTNSGNYQIEFLIDGPGSFFRRDAESTIVSYAKPDLKKSNVRLQSENTLVLGFKPRDNYKNYLGANQTNNISVAVQDGQVRYISDQMNGRYVTRLFGKKVKYNNNLIINVLGQNLYSGKLWKLLHRFTFSGMAGIAFPTGDFNTDYQRDFFAEGKFGVRLTAGLFLQFHGGYYSFQNRADFSDLDVSGGGIGLQYNFPLKAGSGWNLYLDGNIGYYSPDFFDESIGFGGAIGLTKTIRSNLAFVLEGQYRNINTNPTSVSFASGALGLRYSFSEFTTRKRVPCECVNCRFFLIPSRISVGYALAYPTGDTQNNFNNGNIIELGLHYPTSSDFNFVIEAARINLPAQMGGNDLMINKVGLGFYYDFGLRKLLNIDTQFPIPNINLGGSTGYYWPDSRDNGIGITGNVALDFPLRRNDFTQLNFKLEGKYYRIFDPSSDIEFFGVSGSAIYSF